MERRSTRSSGESASVTLPQTSPRKAANKKSTAANNKIENGTENDNENDNENENDEEYVEDSNKIPNDDDDDGDEDVVEEEDDDEEDEEDDDDEKNSTVSALSTGTKSNNDSTDDRKKKRKLNNGNSTSTSASTPIDYSKNPEVKDDAMVTPDDVKGDTKIDSSGHLLGGRQFRIKTFTLATRDNGNRLFMLSTETARCMGFRDSYLLFQKHKKLYKVIASDVEKLELISKDIIPNAYRGRTIGIIAARSVFKEFGSQVIVNSRQVTDDYYEQEARDAGGIEGEPVHYVEEYSNGSSSSHHNPNNNLGNNNKSFSQLHNGQSLNGQLQNNMIEKKNILSPANLPPPEKSWVYEHALAVRQFESMLLYDRNETIKARGIRDPYTGIVFVPQTFQPDKTSFYKVKENSKTGKLIFDTILKDSIFKRIKTGLSDVPREIFEDCVSEDVKKAILEQQRLESL
ncbi:hypothetical protein BVG19_g3685 [[Candida] boidinii]|nr:hypothetical protein BVG19_g3685 [[Candida] boidinii]OWB51760.1 hypothetical protein B5S27_g3326 [[Candida] boidinii]